MNRGSAIPTWAVIFDCDGVVVDSEPLGLASLETVVQKYNLPLRRPALDVFCGKSDAATYAELTECYGCFCTPEQFVTDILEAYSTAVTKYGLRAFAGLTTLLDALSVAGVPYGIGSSSQRSKLHTTLKAAQLLDRFSVMVGGDDVAEAKPAPDIFQEAARRLQTPPCQCVVIEDSPTGIRAARNAGMACIGVTTSFHPNELAAADLIVDGLTQIDVPMLQRLALCDMQNRR